MGRVPCFYCSTRSVSSGTTGRRWLESVRVEVAPFSLDLQTPMARSRPVETMCGVYLPRLFLPALHLSACVWEEPRQPDAATLATMAITFFFFFFWKCLGFRCLEHFDEVPLTLKGGLVITRTFSVHDWTLTHSFLTLLDLKTGHTRIS